VLKAAQLVLDRVGFHPTVALDVARSDEGPPDWGPFMSAEQMQQIGQWIAEAKERMVADAERRQRELEAPIEAEVVDVDAPEMGAAPTGVNLTVCKPEPGEA
jgi:hypothetical protein